MVLASHRVTPCGRDFLPIIGATTCRLPHIAAFKRGLSMVMDCGRFVSLDSKGDGLVGRVTLVVCRPLEQVSGE